MKTTNQIDVEKLANEFNDHSVNVFPKYLTTQLIDAKKNYKARIPHVIAMKRKAHWSTEDVRQAFNYNEHNFKLIQYNAHFISIFQSFIEMTKDSDLDVITKSQRIRFSKDCILKLYRIIAIYKATIMTG